MQRKAEIGPSFGQLGTDDEWPLLSDMSQTGSAVLG